MDETRALAREGAPDGTVVVARMQTAGRGRQGREWVSRAGNLLVSVLLRPGLPPARMTELGFVAALAVADTVDAALHARRARLKWPNDVLVDGAKTAGILVELTEDGAAILGIGINVTDALTAMPYPVTSLHAAGATGDAEAVLATLLDTLDRTLAAWHQLGFATIRAAWMARGPAYGETIRLRVGEQVTHGRFAGLDTDGALLIAAETGGTSRVTAGEVLLSSR